MTNELLIERDELRMEVARLKAELVTMRNRVKPLVEYIRAAAMYGSKWPSNVLREWDAGEKEADHAGA